MIAWLPAALWALGLFLLSEVRGTPSAVEAFLPVPDKLVHLVLYLAFGGSLAWAKRASRTEVPHALLLVLGAVYGAIDEWHQSFVPGRTPEFSDWLADLAGVLVGYLIVAQLVAWSSNGPQLDGE